MHALLVRNTRATNARLRPDTAHDASRQADAANGLPMTSNFFCAGVQSRPSSHTLCRRPLFGEHRGTYSVSSIGGVGSTFLLEWLKRLHRVFQDEAACGNTSSPSACTVCPALARRGSLPRHLVSCHIDDDGIFKHLGDPASLSGFGAGHRAVYLVGSPSNAVASVFRRRFQCWHFHRLHDCWFTRQQRDGRIPCDAPTVERMRIQHGEAATACRVPPVGPLSSLQAYSQHGTDLFGSLAQFRAWLSCRRPRCAFDILVIRYESLNASLPTLFDFLDLPPQTRALFPHAKLRGATARHTRRGGGGAPSNDEMARLQHIYAPLEAAVARLPAEGLWLRNG